MVFQNDLDPSFNKIACYFTSIAHIKENTAEELNFYWGLCKKLGYIDSKDCIYSPNGVANVLKTGLSFKGKFYLDYKPSANDYVIGCWKLTKEADEAHFVVMDNSGIYTREHVIYDPFRNNDGSGSKTVRVGLCTSLRVFIRASA